MIRRALAALVVLVLLAGCGGAAGGEEGTAQLWVTRDRGARLLIDTEVDAGQTLMRALASKADVETRYGGRYVQSVNGIEGSLAAQHDWFWFVNGYEGDRSASSYRLQDGDVAWFDYRAWEREGEARVVVGAFPEPFLHGYMGEMRPVAVRYAPGREAGARALGRFLHATSVAPLSDTPSSDANVFYTVSGSERFTASLRESGGAAGSPVRFTFAGDAAALARHPDRFRYRYSVP